VRAFTAQHTVDLPLQSGVTLASINRLNDQLRLNGEQQLNVMQERQRLLEGVTLELQAQNIATPTPLALSDPAEIQKRIVAKKDELQQLETRASDKHPDVKRLKDEIAGLEREAAARETDQKAVESGAKPPEPSKDLPPARKRALDSLDGQLARLKQVETDTRAAIAQYERRLEGVPAVQQEFQLLTRDQQSAKEQYDTLMKQYNDAQFVASMETDRQGERFRILESAIPPDGPKAPNRMRLLLMGLLLAIGAAIGAVLVAEQLDSSFHSLDELRHFTRVPVLAAIPAIDAASGRRRAHVAVAIVGALAMIGLAGALSAHVANNNQQIVRFLART
jgi:protein tyrosine kinase modulator